MPLFDDIPVTPEANKVTYWPCDTGDRVQYRVSSGFCTQAYEGTVIEVNDDQAKVSFDPDWVEWIDMQYLTILTP
jgi:hypothetical protein